MSSPRFNLGHLLCTQNKAYNIFIEWSQVSYLRLEGYLTTHIAEAIWFDIKLLSITKDCAEL